jgi:hypothetical protein
LIFDFEKQFDITNEIRSNLQKVDVQTFGRNENDSTNEVQEKEKVPEKRK